MARVCMLATLQSRIPSNITNRKALQAMSQARIARVVQASGLGISQSAAVAARRLLAEARIPGYATPGQAARAFMHLARHRRNQKPGPH